MSRLLSRARRTHRCTLCAHPIPPGSDYVRDAIRPWDHPDNEGFGSYKVHYGCHSYWQEIGAEQDWILPDPYDLELVQPQPLPLLLALQERLRQLPGYRAAVDHHNWLLVECRPHSVLQCTVLDGYLQFRATHRGEPDRYELADPVQLRRGLSLWLGPALSALVD